jgi:hypothetical protein
MPRPEASESANLPPPGGDTQRAEKYIKELIDLLTQNKLLATHTDLTKFDPSALQDHYRVDIKTYQLEVSHSKQPATGHDMYVLLFINSPKIDDFYNAHGIIAYLMLNDDQFKRFKAVADEQIETRAKVDEEKRFSIAVKPIDELLDKIFKGEASAERETTKDTPELKPTDPTEPVLPKRSEEHLSSSSKSEQPEKEEANNAPEEEKKDEEADKKEETVKSEEKPAEEKAETEEAEESDTDSTSQAPRSDTGEQTEEKRASETEAKPSTEEAEKTETESVIETTKSEKVEEAPRLSPTLEDVDKAMSQISREPGPKPLFEPPKNLDIPTVETLHETPPSSTQAAQDQVKLPIPVTTAESVTPAETSEIPAPAETAPTETPSPAAEAPQAESTAAEQPATEPTPTPAPENTLNVQVPIPLPKHEQPVLPKIDPPQIPQAEAATAEPAPAAVPEPAPSEPAPAAPVQASPVPTESAAPIAAPVETPPAAPIPMPTPVAEVQPIASVPVESPIPISGPIEAPQPVAAIPVPTVENTTPVTTQAPAPAEPTLPGYQTIPVAAPGEQAVTLAPPGQDPFAQNGLNQNVLTADTPTGSAAPPMNSLDQAIDQAFQSSAGNTITTQTPPIGTSV